MICQGTMTKEIVFNISERIAINGSRNPVVKIMVWVRGGLTELIPILRITLMGDGEGGLR